MILVLLRGRKMALTPGKKQKLLEEVQQEGKKALEDFNKLVRSIGGYQEFKKSIDKMDSRNKPNVIDPDKLEEHDYKLNLKKIYFYPEPSKGGDAGIYNGLKGLDTETKAAIAMEYANSPKYDLETYLTEKIAENKDKPRSGRAKP